MPVHRPCPPVSKRSGLLRTLPRPGNWLRTRVSPACALDHKDGTHWYIAIRIWSSHRNGYNFIRLLEIQTKSGQCFKNMDNKVFNARRRPFDIRGFAALFAGTLWDNRSSLFLGGSFRSAHYGAPSCEGRRLVDLGPRAITPTRRSPAKKSSANTAPCIADTHHSGKLTKDRTNVLFHLAPAYPLFKMPGLFLCTHNDRLVVRFEREH